LKPSRRADPLTSFLLDLLEAIKARRPKHCDLNALSTLCESGNRLVSTAHGVTGMHHVVYRPFNMTDAPALMSWAKSADELLQWAGPNFSFPLDEEQLRAYAKGASDSRHLISGVYGSGEVVAHAELNLLPQHRLGQVRRVAVAPRARGLGLVARS
jgi:hypothetical protein